MIDRSQGTNRWKWHLLAQFRTNSHFPTKSKYRCSTIKHFDKIFRKQATVVYLNLLKGDWTSLCSAKAISFRYLLVIRPCPRIKSTPTSTKQTVPTKQDIFLAQITKTHGTLLSLVAYVKTKTPFPKSRRKSGPMRSPNHQPSGIRPKNPQPSMPTEPLAVRLFFPRTHPSQISRYPWIISYHRAAASAGTA